MCRPPKTRGQQVVKRLDNGKVANGKKNTQQSKINFSPCNTFRIHFLLQLPYSTRGKEPSSFPFRQAKNKTSIKSKTLFFRLDFPNFASGGEGVRASMAASNGCASIRCADASKLVRNSFPGASFATGNRTFFFDSVSVTE